MKRLILLPAFIALFAFTAHSQNKGKSNIFSHLQENALVLNKNGVLRERDEIREYVQSLVQTQKTSYKKEFSIEVNTQLDYEAGELKIGSNFYSVMFLKQKKDDNSFNIEFLVIYAKNSSTKPRSEIDQARVDWMKLCNSHQAGELVKQLYTPDAYYYNRGRLLRGTESITEEYGYMNNPTYSLQLTPKYVNFVSDDIVFEIGRCSGSYPNPYMLLWQRRSDGKWQVLMDSNY